MLIFATSVVNAQDNLPVAMVADIQGQVMLEYDGQRQPCEILTEVTAGSKLHLEANSTLTLFYYNSSKEYTYNSAGEILVGEEQPQAISGKQPSSRDLDMSELAGIAMEDQEGIALELLKLRGMGAPELRLINPIDTKVLNPDPEFTWHPVENVQSYRFILSDDLGLAMADITVEEGSSLELPEDVKLDEGIDYTWEVVAHLPAETEYRTHASFSVLEASTREHVEAARPGPGASFAERAVYARMLERLDLKMAATKIWQELALLRPEQKSLQQRIRGESEG